MFQRLRDLFASIWWAIKSSHLEGPDGVCADYN